MPRLKVNGVAIDDTFAEAFGMRATALVITAPNRKWARQAAVSMTGFATSVIGCGCEAAIDVDLPPSETPDGRPGCRVMIFAVSTDELQKQLQKLKNQALPIRLQIFLGFRSHPAKPPLHNNTSLGPSSQV